MKLRGLALGVLLALGLLASGCASSRSDYTPYGTLSDYEASSMYGPYGYSPYYVAPFGPYWSYTVFPYYPYYYRLPAGPHRRTARNATGVTPNMSEVRSPEIAPTHSFHASSHGR